MSKQYHSDKDFTVPNNKLYQPDQLVPFSKPTIYIIYNIDNNNDKINEIKKVNWDVEL